MAPLAFGLFTVDVRRSRITLSGVRCRRERRSGGPLLRIQRIYCLVPRNHLLLWLAHPAGDSAVLLSDSPHSGKAPRYRLCALSKRGALCGGGVRGRESVVVILDKFNKLDVIFHMDPQDLFGRRRRFLDVKANAGPQMDPHLAELLASANVDHVLERGTGSFDLLIESLSQKLRDPKNAPFFPRILAAIQRLKCNEAIDPIRVNTRNGIRQILGSLGGDILGPRGPMELE